MTTAARYVPCLEPGTSCNLDWTAISAVGGMLAAGLTAVAVVVALFVGVWPILYTRKQRARIGRAEARIASVDLGMQALHISAALKLLEPTVCAPHIFQVATGQFSLLSYDACVRVIPFLDCLPDALEPPLAFAIADIGAGIRALPQIPAAKGIAVNTVATRQLYADVLASMERAKYALVDAVGNGFTAEATEPSATLLAEKLKAQADSVLLQMLQGRPNHR